MLDTPIGEEHTLSMTDKRTDRANSNRSGLFRAICTGASLLLTACVLVGCTDSTSHGPNASTPIPTPSPHTRTTAPVPTEPANVPVLGRIWALGGQQGYGQVRPTLIYDGGDPTGRLININWASWGTARATGAGLGWTPGATVASGHWEPMHVVAFDLGPCRGHLAYRAIEWYSPRAGEHFNPHLYINICTGKYVGL